MAERLTVLEEVDEVEDLAGDEAMLLYRVMDLDRFFDVYNYTDEEEGAIAGRWQFEQLYVNQDGSVFWGYGDYLIEPDGELLDQDQFIAEAEAVGVLVE